MTTNTKEIVNRDIIYNDKMTFKDVHGKKCNISKKISRLVIPNKNNSNTNESAKVSPNNMLICKKPIQVFKKMVKTTLHTKSSKTKKYFSNLNNKFKHCIDTPCWHRLSWWDEKKHKGSIKKERNHKKNIENKRMENIETERKRMETIETERKRMETIETERKRMETIETEKKHKGSMKKERNHKSSIETERKRKKNIKTAKLAAQSNKMNQNKIEEILKEFTKIMKKFKRMKKLKNPENLENLMNSLNHTSKLLTKWNYRGIRGFVTKSKYKGMDQGDLSTKSRFIYLPTIDKKKIYTETNAIKALNNKLKMHIKHVNSNEQPMTTMMEQPALTTPVAKTPVAKTPVANTPPKPNNKRNKIHLTHFTYMDNNTVTHMEPKTLNTQGNASFSENEQTMINKARKALNKEQLPNQEKNALSIYNELKLANTDPTLSKKHRKIINRSRTHLAKTNYHVL